MIGYFLSSEEYTPAELLDQARRAEEAGFEALWISDHFHPWNDEQGQSPFVWSIIGAIAQVCSLPVTTAVTCPTTRIHPVIIAQAAATSAVLLNGEFRLGVGTGEALNEHVTGARWPSILQRLEQLEEAVEVMRRLWTGEFVTFHGQHYTVENARIYTRPDDPPPVYVSGFGPNAAELAGRIGDGFISTSPDREGLQRFRDSGGAGKPSQVGYKVCWGRDPAAAIATATSPASSTSTGTRCCRRCARSDAAAQDLTQEPGSGANLRSRQQVREDRKIRHHTVQGGAAVLGPARPQDGRGMNGGHRAVHRYLASGERALFRRPAQDGAVLLGDLELGAEQGLPGGGA